MTKVMLIENLKEFITNTVSSFSLPCQLAKGDAEQIFRAPEVHRMRLPDSNSATKKAPYIIVQAVEGDDFQKNSDVPLATCIVRLIFCVYCENEEEGAMMLLNVMERVRQALLETWVVGDCFRLDGEEGIGSIIYPDDTAPFYAGEMIMKFFIPPIRRQYKQEI